MLTLKLKRTNLFYLYSGLFLLAGWVWLLWSVYSRGYSEITVCFIKNTAGIPCPGCGSTTSVLHLAKGRWMDALQANPLGYIIAAGLVLLPLWWLADVLRGGNSMHRAMMTFDDKVRKRPLLLALILLPLLLNWIWNIMKM